MIIICLLSRAENTGNKTRLAIAFREAKHLLKAAGDPVRRHRYQLSREAVQNCCGTVSPIISIADLKIHTCTGRHTYIGGMTAGIIDIPGIGSRCYCEKSQKQRDNSSCEPPLKLTRLLAGYPADHDRRNLG